jgi:hypothetical protein
MAKDQKFRIEVEDDKGSGTMNAGPMARHDPTTKALLAKTRRDLSVLVKWSLWRRQAAPRHPRPGRRDGWPTRPGPE